MEDLNDFRAMLMDDFDLSPEITHNCAQEIKDRCNHELRKKGATLHCLMNAKDDLSITCISAVSCTSCLMLVHGAILKVYIQNVLFFLVN